MELMKRSGELITEQRISPGEGSGRGGEDGGTGRKSGMNEGGETDWSSRVQPLSPAGSPDRGRLHRLAAQAPLGSGPGFCPNYQLCFTEEGQRGEKISLSTPTPPHPTAPPTNTTLV